jgi:predicted transporter
MGEIMKGKSPVFLWSLFVLAGCLTWVAYIKLWTYEQWWSDCVIILFFALSVFLGIMILKRTGLKTCPVLCIAVGLFVGQYWLVIAIVFYVVELLKLIDVHV